MPSVEGERPMPARVLLCTVHRDEFYLPLDEGEETTRCPEPGCEAPVEVYARLGEREDGAVTCTLTIPPDFDWDEDPAPAEGDCPACGAPQGAPPAGPCVAHGQPDARLSYTTKGDGDDER